MSDEDAGDRGQLKGSGNSSAALSIAAAWVLSLGIDLFLHAVAGAVIWGALVVGLYSISTAPPSLLAGWWLGQTVELAFAGGVLGAVANGVPITRVWMAVGLAVVALLAATVALQSSGLAPAMKVVR